MLLLVVTFSLCLIRVFVAFYLGIEEVEWKNLMMGMSHISYPQGGFLTENCTTLDSV